jgi:hypothetical protein
MRPFFLWMAATLLLSACLGAPLESAEIGTPIALDPNRDGPVVVGALEYRGGIALPQGEGTSGLSSLVVSQDGQSFVAMSDRGTVLFGRLLYDPEGLLTRIADFGTAQICDAPRRKLSGFRADTEALARLPDGGWLVAFERRHKILRYGAGGLTTCGAGTALTLPQDAGLLPSNEGIEAMVALPDGRLLLIAEATEADEARHPAWIGTSGNWERLSYAGVAGFKPTDATLLPDGDLLVLERAASWLGFAVRLVRVPAARIGRTPFSGTEIARLRAPMTVDNFEGLSARRGKEGETLIYLVSDDNFSNLQRTLLFQFALKR